MTTSPLPEQSPETAPSPAPIHLGAIDGLRGLTAVYVLAFHVLAAFDYWGKPLPSVIAPLNYVLGYGHSAVSVFILISGFCLMLPVVRRGALAGEGRTFLLRRATRILPTYYAALVASILLCLVISPTTASVYSAYLPVTRRAVLYHVLLIHDLTTDLNARINGPFWSIAVEWRIYFFFPILVWLWFRFGWKTSVIVSLAASALLTWIGLLPAVAPLVNTQLNGATPQYLGLFSLGMMAAGIAMGENPTLLRLRNRVPWGMLSTLLGIGTLIVLNWQFISPRLFRTTENIKPLEQYQTDVAVALWIVCLLITVTQKQSGWGRRLLNLPLLTFLGTFSFSIYLMHMPFLQLFWEYALVPLFPDRALVRCLLLMLLGIPVVIAASYGFYMLAEKPVLRWRSKQ